MFLEGETIHARDEHWAGKGSRSQGNRPMALSNTNNKGNESARRASKVSRKEGTETREAYRLRRKNHVG